MLRYFCPIILAGGKSSRFGYNKVFFKVNELSLIDWRINFFFKLGFSLVYVSGYFNGYSSFFDEFLNFGPLIGIFTTYSYFFNKHFTHFIYLAVDVNFFSVKIIFLMFLRSKIFYSSCFNVYIFPFLLAISFNVFYSLFFLSFLIDFYFLSLSFFLNCILLERIYIDNFYLKHFFNFNIYHNYFLFIWGVFVYFRIWFGIRYVGVAIGETITFSVSPLFSILTTKMDLKHYDIFTILDFWKPNFIVIGYPISEFYDNSKLLDKIDLFAFKIRCFYNGHVIFVDENLSSWKARRILNFKKNKDFFTINALSATFLIKQCFLENVFFKCLRNYEYL